MMTWVSVSSIKLYPYWAVIHHLPRIYNQIELPIPRDIVAPAITELFLLLIVEVVELFRK